MISSVGSYDVTALSTDKSNSALVAIGWPISRLEPWTMISGCCWLAIAARTACSTSLASRTFRVSTPSVPRFRHDHVEMAVFVTAIRIPDHPSKGVAERHKGELSRTARGRPSTGWVAGSRADVMRPTCAAGHIGHARLGSCARRSHFDRYRSICVHISSYIELYL